MASQAQILIPMVNALKDYTQNRINPVLKPRLETNLTFMPEVVTTFSSKEVFENFRKKPEYKDIAQKVSVGDMSVDFEESSHDEILT
ncbi:hypothetical protein [Nostoc sp.]|uniref:hypothetical protein n=1 Tax=Nostoc sp. TaxID=1180 RepID=UPI002FF52A34